MTGNSMAAAILSYHFDRRPRLEPGEKCGNKACAMHGGPRYVGLDGVRRCTRCHNLYGQSPVWAEPPEVIREGLHQGIGNQNNRHGKGGKRVDVPDAEQGRMRELWLEGTSICKISELFGHSRKVVARCVEES